MARTKQTGRMTQSGKIIRRKLATKSRSAVKPTPGVKIEFDEAIKSDIKRCLGKVGKVFQEFYGFKYVLTQLTIQYKVKPEVKSYFNEYEITPELPISLERFVDNEVKETSKLF